MEFVQHSITTPKGDTVERTPGIDHKYGEVVATGKDFHPGEPVFVLRAQDPLGPHLVRIYAELCEVAGVNSDHVVTALESAERMAAWQATNPKLVKQKPG